ncbi:MULTISPECIES: ABC transporter permease [unclassified Bacillus (in: firmicutes)]|uniref:ABC transporter permease n=1 Tax=unclassified Bacillus (in: firmicutes) TaxID=185979 RepID=UPI0008EF7865|nr:MULTISPECIES: ABC transporter permease [unclassified Bacillus (in: firmicutes)]SFB09613.1 ABC-2 type transport system permease protein [Bacillus sp. UNCCL13]SFQ86635.1 ABC-2 type transport system permease protein [Bacillus sp. cl95]
MRKAWTICGMELQRILKKRQSYLLMFAMPLLFTLIFGSLLGEHSEDKMTILWVDQDQSDLSKQLYKSLKENQSVFEVKKSTQKNAERLLDNKDFPGAIILSKGFEGSLLASEQPEIKFQKIPEFTSSSTITQIVSDRLAKLLLSVTASKKWSDYSGEAWQVMYEKVGADSDISSMPIQKLNLDAKKSNPELNEMSGRAAGFSIMFVMIMMMSVTGTILEARKNGVWYRMLTMPASKLEIASGYLLSFFLIGWIQFGVLILATHFIFDVNWGDPLAIVVLVSALLLAIVGLGLFIAGIVKTAEQQASIGNLVVVATCMVSGVYWPIEIEPDFMQKIAGFLPQRWAMSGFADLLANGGTLVDILDNVAILMGFALLFLIVGMRRIRFE